MGAQDIVEEEFYRGEYFGYFADYLATNKFAKLRKTKNSRHYSFSHENLNHILLEVDSSEMGLWHARHYTVKIMGPKEQLVEFKRAAENHLNNAVSSLGTVKKQLEERASLGRT